MGTNMTSANMSFDDHSSMAAQAEAHLGLPWPEIMVSEDNNMPTQVHHMSDDWVPPWGSFSPGPASSVTLTNANTPQNDYTQAYDASQGQTYDSSQGQMDILSSSFSFPDPASDPVNPRPVSPQHATPHAGSLSFSDYDRRYWQGFEDGLKAQLTPTLPSAGLPAHVRRSSVGLGNGMAINQQQSSGMFTRHDSGIFTAPATPLDAESGHDTSSTAHLKGFYDQKVGAFISAMSSREYSMRIART